MKPLPGLHSPVVTVTSAPVAELLTLLSSPRLSVVDVCCRSPRSGASVERGGETTHLALVRRGVFVYHLGWRAFVADPCTALLHRGARGYRVSHPGDTGDDLTVFDLDAGLVDELFGQGPRVAFGATPAVQLLHHRLHAALANASQGAPAGEAPQALELEERVLELLSLLVRGDPRAGPALGRRDRRLVETVKARLGAELERNLPLSSLAAEVGVSPFHLMRVFRAATGLPVRAYRRRLRVLAALDGLDAGRDLAGLAAELGFSHHSHLTDSFREVLGVPPSRLRQARREGSGGDETRTFLEAGAPAPR